MEVKSFTLHNIGRFSELKVPLAPLKSGDGSVTVFVGNNGSGKTSILRSLATSLSWLVSRIVSEKGNGSPISEQTIKNGENSAAIEIHIHDDDGSNSEIWDDYFATWVVAKARKGRESKFSSKYAQLTLIAGKYRSALSSDETISLPLVALYPVERVIDDISLKIKKESIAVQLAGYEKSLGSSIDFSRFFEWFREREDTENESGMSDDTLEELKDWLGDDNPEWKRLRDLNASSRDPQLTAVRTAIYEFIPEFSNLRVKRKPRLHMSVDKDGETLDVTQLSQGEKSLMALIGDIARRLAIMNPSLDNPLEGDGIILIDEVDMHLHPQWQRSLIDKLTSTFSNCQFVLTTHSPLVISDSKSVLTYLIGDDDEITQLPSLYGEDANSVLLDIMDTNVRNAEVDSKLNDLLDAIHDSKIPKAKKLLEGLEAELPSRNLELSKARLLLRKQELRVAKNN